MVLLGVPLIVNVFPLIEVFTPDGKPVTFALGTAPAIVKTMGVMSCPKQLFCVMEPLVSVTVADGLKVIEPVIWSSPPKDWIV